MFSEIYQTTFWRDKTREKQPHWEVWIFKETRNQPKDIENQLFRIFDIFNQEIYGFIKAFDFEKHPPAERENS